MNRVLRKCKRRKDAPEPARLSGRDRLQICGCVALVVAALVAYFAIRVRYEMRIFSESMRRTVNGWRMPYHLDDVQVARIMEVEFAFHGNGNQFTRHPKHTPEDIEQHHREIAAVMKPEDAARFLEDQKHPRKSRH